ncbi:MAG: proline dehydrogenase [Polyangiaceae bacterium]|nr:proline dehydrogenase [Polyangiaceae bacterium]
MTEPVYAKMQRVLRLVGAARRVADPSDPIGRKARVELARVTRLSPQGVELALTRCLEVQPSEEELETLCLRTPSAGRSHVLLSASVFVAAHRAIALGLASSPRVEVRPSRREPVMAALLLEASGGAFRIVEEIGPLPGDHVWAYGSDATLDALRGELPAGVVLHGHGTGLGAALVEPQGGVDETSFADRVAAELAVDVALFDQRGCLSPRVVLTSSPDFARLFAAALARELAELEQRVPRGWLSPDERAAATRYRDTMLYLADVVPAGEGFVGLDLDGNRMIAPPVGRLVHVATVEEPTQAIARLGPVLAAVGVACSAELQERIRQAVPLARVSAVGQMQRPPFDGPVDLRAGAEGERL